ncbi:putative emp24/gp25L/p24 family/GOLD [Blattamonas nauphoetae]|uniref:Emp24/gp25L/p24 family/GOLD n=1 Tax=Blattamonas nauphoetae TaxID=2049346 RepID=A0ABQ9YKV8_9EUKA|nr:putative emp24/gp25L/p24 family/GOLD [Blattamonas nauphoetae]
MFILSFFLFFSSSNSILVEVPNMGDFCLKEPLEKGDEFTYVINLYQPSKTVVDLQLINPQGVVVNQKSLTDNYTIKSKASQQGDYSLCFYIPAGSKDKDSKKQILVNVTLYVGYLALLADVDPSKSLNITDNIQSLELLAKDLLDDTTALNQRETKITSRNSQLLVEVKAFSITSVIIVVLVGLAELFYLNKFFKQQKVA